jgi:hypothetical protein
MKQICILCEDSKVELARLNIEVGLNKPSDYVPTATNFGSFTRPAAKFLSVPLSETGESPATHWFCFMNCTDEAYDKFVSMQEHSIIEDSSPKDFLIKYNLKRVR